MTIEEQAGLVKLASPKLAGTTGELRDQALLAVAKALMDNKDAIFDANRQDMEQAEKDGIAAPVLKRLKFDEGKLRDVINGIHDLVQMPDPLFQTKLARELDEGLTLYRETCPIGVIGVIFEARPDALVQISALCIKSGNCVILKGGSEATKSNKILFDTIYAAVREAGLPENCMLQLEARSEINELLTCQSSVDLLIPRGSNAFVQYIMSHTNIPVMGHADGICHIYVDKDADIGKADSNYLRCEDTVCQCLQYRRDIARTQGYCEGAGPKLAQALKEKHVELRGTKEIQALVDCVPATEKDDDTEYLDYILSAKIVESVDEAIDHINRHGSHHTDSIVTENKETALHFMRMVDSAGVYQNCSTRFADGYRYGFGCRGRHQYK